VRRRRPTHGSTRQDAECRARRPSRLVQRKTDGVTPLADAPACTGCCCRGKRRAACPLARGCVLRVNRLAVGRTSIATAARFLRPPPALTRRFLRVAALRVMGSYQPWQTARLSLMVFRREEGGARDRTAAQQRFLLPADSAASEVPRCPEQVRGSFCAQEHGLAHRCQ